MISDDGIARLRWMVQHGQRWTDEPKEPVLFVGGILDGLTIPIQTRLRDCWRIGWAVPLLDNSMGHVLYEPGPDGTRVFALLESVYGKGSNYSLR